MSGPEDIQKKIEQSIPLLSDIAANAELRAAQSANVQLELRTFAAAGSGVKDIKGKELSDYVKPKLIEGKHGPRKDKYGTHAEKRAAKGLQTDHKDLIFTGEFARSITVGLSGGKPALGMLDKRAADIAAGQEEQNKTKIFQLNDAEREAVKKDVKDYVMGALRDMVKSWH